MVDSDTTSDHAVFLVHGLWGNKAHFWFVEEQLQKAHPSLKIHSCSVNEGNRTYDGIDVGGDRVLEEVNTLNFCIDNRLKTRCGNGNKKASSSRNSPLLVIL
jgi:hypothetical protein